MELFGILFSIPIGIVVGLAYAAAAGRFVSRYRTLAKVIFVASVVVLAGFIGELILIGTFGAVGARGRFGPLFWVLHLIVFWLGAPAVANVLVLNERLRYRGYRQLAGVAFGVMFVILVVLQYSVSEELYGLDGTDGPFVGVHVQIS